MRGRTATLLIAMGLAGLAGGVAMRAHGNGQAQGAEGNAAVLAKGKEIFMAQCAKCHNESGDKPLSSGLPLNERGLSSEVIARAVNGRLRSKTEEERRGVVLYISSLMKTASPQAKAVPRP